MIGGYSSGGTTEFGNDYYREYWQNEMAPLVGGGWSSNSTAGVFHLSLSTNRNNANAGVGSRASVYL